MNVSKFSREAKEKPGFVSPVKGGDDKVEGETSGKKTNLQGYKGRGYQSPRPAKTSREGTATVGDLVTAKHRDGHKERPTQTHAKETSEDGRQGKGKPPARGKGKAKGKEQMQITSKTTRLNRTEQVQQVQVNSATDARVTSKMLDSNVNALSRLHRGPSFIFAT